MCDQSNFIFRVSFLFLLAIDFLVPQSVVVDHFIFMLLRGLLLMKVCIAFTVCLVGLILHDSELIERT